MNSKSSTSDPVQAIGFRLHLSSEQYKAYYQGQVQFIQVQSFDGRKIRFPANAVRQYLTMDGIHGELEIQFDQNNKLIGVVKRGS